MIEHKDSTGSIEGHQGSAGSTDAKKNPTGSVSRKNICTRSLVHNGVSAGHAGGNKEHMAPADDKKDSTGSADLKKVKCQRQTRKAQQKQPAQGRYQQRTSNCKKEMLNTDSSSSLTTRLVGNLALFDHSASPLTLFVHTPKIHLHLKHRIK